jgi:uncharacterized protein (TIGR03435 family)
MRNRFASMMCAGLLFAGAALGQTAPAPQSTTMAPPAAAPLEFDVASVHPVDLAQLQADMRAGKMPNFGIHLDGLRAEYNDMSLKQLTAIAYKVKDYQISGPDWMATTLYNITARLPEGSKKDDAAAMLKTLLEDRFKMKAHLEDKERPVMALVAAKGGVKMKEVPAPPPIDETVELKPGERKMDLPDGPAVITISPGGVGATMNMGERGSYVQKMDMTTQTFKIDATAINMSGMVDLLSQLMQIGGGGTKQVVNETGLTGHYDISFSFSIAELMAMAKAQGQAVAGNSGNNAASEASDPGGAGTSVYAALEKAGLKLESRKAVVQQLIVESAEKTPTEN